MTVYGQPGIGAVADLLNKPGERTEAHGVDKEVQLTFRYCVLGKEVVERGPECLGLVEDSGARRLDELGEFVMYGHAGEHARTRDVALAIASGAPARTLSDQSATNQQTRERARRHRRTWAPGGLPLDPATTARPKLARTWHEAGSQTENRPLTCYFPGGRNRDRTCDRLLVRQELYR